MAAKVIGPVERIWRTARQVVVAVAVVVPLALVALAQAGVHVDGAPLVAVTGAALWFVAAVQNAYENGAFKAYP